MAARVSRLPPRGKLLLGCLNSSLQAPLFLPVGSSNALAGHPQERDGDAADDASAQQGSHAGVPKANGIKDHAENADNKNEGEYLPQTQVENLGFELAPLQITAVLPLKLELTEKALRAVGDFLIISAKNAWWRYWTLPAQLFDLAAEPASRIAVILVAVLSCPCFRELRALFARVHRDFRRGFALRPSIGLPQPPANPH